MVYTSDAAEIICELAEEENKNTCSGINYYCDNYTHTHTHTPVSYTHLDVYKRQALCRPTAITLVISVEICNPNNADPTQ